jgi:hypothetical protein
MGTVKINAPTVWEPCLVEIAAIHEGTSCVWEPCKWNGQLRIENGCSLMTGCLVCCCTAALRGNFVKGCKNI